MKPAVSLRLEDFPRALAWSPDAALLAVALGNGRVARLHALSGERLADLPAHAGGVLALAWSPDGRTLATGGEDGRLIFWDAATGSARSEARPGGRAWVEHLAWSPGGDALAAAAGRQLGCWLADGTPQESPAPLAGTITALAWRPDGGAVAAATYGAVTQFRPGETAPLEVLAWKSAYVSLAWSGDGRHLVAGTQESNLIYWPLPFRDEEPLHMSGYAAKVKQLGFDARSRFLATGGGEIVTVWDMAGRGPAGTRPLQLEGHGARVTALAWQRRGQMLATGALDGSLWLWNPAAGEAGLAARRDGPEITALAWSPDDRRLAVATADGTVFIAA
jgi:WD40 repeat protein